VRAIAFGRNPFGAIPAATRSLSDRWPRLGITPRARTRPSAPSRARGGTAGAVPLDIGRSATFPGFINRVTGEINERWQRTTVDYLVNNAGFGPMSMFEDSTSNSALPAGMEAGYSAYATMKGGLAVLTRYMAKELSARRIRVNSVAPGPNPHPNRA
jgi:NAD(P)-dependent dehydrogenase (short-subunit alcohol dehydrogenase family)